MRSSAREYVDVSRGMATAIGCELSCCCRMELGFRVILLCEETQLQMSDQDLRGLEILELGAWWGQLELLCG